jgi:carboxyl-terminal processing protease
MPDVFVPADTSYYSDYYRDLVARGIMNRFVMNYVDGNRQQLISKYSDFKSFNKLYAVERSLIDKLIADGVKEGVDYSEKDYKISYVLLVTQIKALIANNIWGANEYYEIINPLVNTYQEAIELLNSGRMQTLLQR